MKSYSITEVFEMGIEKEKKRRDFYGDVAERFKEKEVKDLFARLKNWEQTHIEKIEEIKERIKAPEPVRLSWEDTDAYFRVFAEDKLYGQVSPDQFSENVKSLADIFRYSISFEKDAVLFFSELLPAVPDEHKKTIKDLVNEEKQHIIYLADLRKKMAK